MAVERKRGCGYRKVGALYLVADGPGMPCCRLPIPLTVCPTCGAGIKQSRGWTWVNPRELFESDADGCPSPAFCPLFVPARLGERAGLLWIGEGFYPTPAHFDKEAEDLGVCRRISSVPRGFWVGTTWVLLAHPKACDHDGELGPGIFKIFRPQRIEQLVTDEQDTPELRESLQKRGITAVVVPANDPDHQGSVYDDDVSDMWGDDADPNS